MDANRAPTWPPSDWIARCARQIRLVDADLTTDEAQELAQNLLSFERTGRMSPEAAVAFVASEFAKQRPRFERRARSR